MLVIKQLLVRFNIRYKVFFSLCAFLFLFLKSNAGIVPVVTIDTIREAKRPEGEFLYYVDPSRKISFEEVQEKTFLNNNSIKRQNGAAYWFQFKIDTKLTEYSYVIGFDRNDFIEVYIPYQSGYEKKTLGQRVYQNPINDIRELNILTFEAREVDSPSHFTIVKPLFLPMG